MIWNHDSRSRPEQTGSLPLGIPGRARLKPAVCFVLLLAALGGVSLPGAAYAATEVHSSGRLDFSIGKVNMWDPDQPLARLEAVALLGHNWNSDYTFGGTVNPVIFPGGCLPWPADDVCWGDVHLGKTGAECRFASAGGIGFGVFAYVTAGDVSTYLPYEFITTFNERDTVRPKGSGPVPAGENFTMSTNFNVDLGPNGANMHVASPGTGMGFIGRLRVTLFFGANAWLLGSDLGSFEPFGAYPGLIIDTFDIPQNYMLLYILGPLVKRNEQVGYQPGQGATATTVPPSAAGTHVPTGTINTYGMTELISTDWPAIQTAITLAISSQLTLALPTPKENWIALSFHWPFYVIDVKPSVSANYVRYYGHKSKMLITIYESLTNIALSAMGFPFGLNRVLKSDAFEVRLQVLDAYQIWRFGYRQEFIHKPQPQASYVFTNGPGPYGVAPPVGDNVTPKLLEFNFSTSFKLPNVNYIDVTPKYGIRDPVDGQLMFPDNKAGIGDFNNSTFIEFQQEIGFALFRAYIRAGDVFSFDFPADLGVTLHWYWNNPIPLIPVFNKTFDLDGPNNGVSPPSYTSPRTALFHFQPFDKPSFRIYPAVPPEINVPNPSAPPPTVHAPLDVVRSANFIGQAPIPNWVNGETFGSQVVPPLTAAEVTDNVSPFFSIALAQNVTPGTMLSMNPADAPGGTSHPVNVTATDQRGNLYTCTTHLVIRDTTAPFFISVPSPIVVHHVYSAADPMLTPVTVPLPTVLDNVDPAPTVVSDSPGNFPIGTTVVTFTTTDSSFNQRVTTTTVSVLNDPPVPELGGPYVVNEGESIGLSASATDLENDPVQFDWDMDKNGSFELVNQTGATFNAIDGPQTVSVLVRTREDIPDHQNTVVKSLNVTVLNVAPTITGSVTGPTTPVAVAQEIFVNAPFTDPGVLDTHTASIDWGDGTVTSGNVLEANGDGTMLGSHAYTEGGLYTVTITVTDKDGESDSAQFKYVMVFDNTHGSVKGGGKFTLDPGDLPGSPALGGEAIAKVSAKYKKDQTVPTGKFQFKFKGGALAFKSTLIGYLGVSGGNKAHFIGTGLLNKVTPMEFFGSMTDDDINGDTLRIRIWNPNTLDVLVDTQPGDPEDVDPATGLLKGRITVVP